MTLNKDIAKGLAVFERKNLRRIFGAIKVNENWRKRHNKELKKAFGDLDILSFVRISRLKWIGHAHRMESNRTVSQVFNNNPQGSRPGGRPRNRWWNFVQTDIKKCKINNWKKGQKTELTGKGPLRGRRSALDCSATEDPHWTVVPSKKK
jgi:hypothetical protein